MGATGLVAEAFLLRDLPDASPAERRAAAGEVEGRIAAMPDLMRLGVRVAGTASHLVLSVMARRRFDRASPERRAELVDRLERVPLPLVGEYVRLTRGLALAAVVEARTVPAEGPG